MKYYRVNRYHYNGRHSLVANELLTENELKRFYPEIIPLHYVIRGILTEVIISSHQTYHSFGCRFEIPKDTE